MTATVVTLAAQAALAANLPVIRTLRLVGATDGFIARAFVRRFTLRALAGAGAGTALGLVVAALLPGSGGDGFLAGLGFRGAGWLWPLVSPPAATATAWAATRYASYRMLRSLA